MKQKIIYKLFLIIGSLFILSNSSCDKQEIDYIVNTKYYYNNLSQYDIDMEVFNSSGDLIKDYSIQSLDTLMISIVAEGGAGPFQFADTKEYGDSICLTFSDMRFLTFRKDFDSIFFEKAYKKIKISDKEYKMYYDFTDEDYENALEIK